MAEEEDFDSVCFIQDVYEYTKEVNDSKECRGSKWQEIPILRTSKEGLRLERLVTFYSESRSKKDIYPPFTHTGIHKPVVMVLNELGTISPPF